MIIAYIFKKKVEVLPIEDITRSTQLTNVSIQGYYKHIKECVTQHASFVRKSNCQHNQLYKNNIEWIDLKQTEWMMGQASLYIQNR